MIVILYLFDFAEFKLAVRNAGIHSKERYTLAIAGGKFGTRGHSCRIVFDGAKEEQTGS
jgi:hypothetical protein